MIGIRFDRSSVKVGLRWLMTPNENGSLCESDQPRVPGARSNKTLSEAARNDRFIAL